jgi:hypothetical protein
LSLCLVSNRKEFDAVPLSVKPVQFEGEPTIAAQCERVAVDLVIGGRLVPANGIDTSTGLLEGVNEPLCMRCPISRRQSEITSAGLS